MINRIIISYDTTPFGQNAPCCPYWVGHPLSLSGCRDYWKGVSSSLRLMQLVFWGFSGPKAEGGVRWNSFLFLLVHELEECCSGIMATTLCRGKGDCRQSPGKTTRYERPVQAGSVVVALSPESSSQVYQRNHKALCLTLPFLKVPALVRLLQRTRTYRIFSFLFFKFFKFNF